MISNISLLTAETITGETNDKDPTFKKQSSPDNYEVKTILIGFFCVFEKNSTAGALLERDANICGDQLIIHHRERNLKNI